ncbi:MAG: hypothetical protein L3J71_02495 [Victivallaceae bacterium]|nr:hypothetical protein [Victivallaceae bacterium]
MRNYGLSFPELANQGFTATVILVSGNYTYIAYAPTGTAVTDARWAVKRVLTDGSASEGTTVWAGGTNDQINKANNLTALAYN